VILSKVKWKVLYEVQGTEALLKYKGSLPYLDEICPYIALGGAYLRVSAL
jgi:hypothetical protein